MQSAGKITKQNISKIFQMKTRFQQNQLFGAKPEKEIYIDKKCQKKPAAVDGDRIGRV